MTIILEDGPCDGDILDDIPDQCVYLRRSAVGAAARYKTTGADDPDRRRIFGHCPPGAGEPEVEESVHDA